MPEEKPAVAEKATEAPVKSSREILEDSILSEFEPTDKATAEPAESESAGEDVEEIISGIKPGETPVETPDGDDDELDDILRDTPKTEEDKSKVQIRIDKLSAELKAAKEELASVRAQKEQEKPKDPNAPRYSEAQLKSALKKALEEGDADLAWDIMEERNKIVEQKLIKMYQDEKKAGSEAARKINEEWIDIKSQNIRYVDPKMPEIFPGSREVLNLDDDQSMLYRAAKKLYGDIYHSQPGGQRLAVADAMTRILARYMSKGDKTKKIERQLLKEKRKKSIPGEGSLEADEKVSKPSSNADILDDVLSERRRFRSERGA